jgi:hypothetical protein
MFRQSTLFQKMNSSQALLYERLMGFLRLLFLIVSGLLFAALCIRWLEDINVWAIADQMRLNAGPTLIRIPTIFWVLFRIPFLEWQYSRYLIAPIGAFLLIFVSSALYVQDIYHLPSIGKAFHYVIASLFAMFYPIVQID